MYPGSGFSINSTWGWIGCGVYLQDAILRAKFSSRNSWCKNSINLFFNHILLLGNFVVRKLKNSVLIHLVHMEKKVSLILKSPLHSEGTTFSNNVLGKYLNHAFYIYFEKSRRGSVSVTVRIQVFTPEMHSILLFHEFIK